MSNELVSFNAAFDVNVRCECTAGILWYTALNQNCNDCKIADAKSLDDLAKCVIKRNIESLKNDVKWMEYVAKWMGAKVTLIFSNSEYTYICTKDEKLEFEFKAPIIELILKKVIDSLVLYFYELYKTEENFNFFQQLQKERK